ncbi:MAG: hypothetical protein WCL00_10305, partial [Bacteroidota bacterium]
MSGPSIICQNSAGVVYSTQQLPHAIIYEWHLPPGAVIVSGSSTNSITVDFGIAATSGYIYVKGRNKCGDYGLSDSLAITIVSLPVPTISGTSNVCSEQNYTYTTQTGNSQYVWSFSSGGSLVTGGGGNDATITISWTTAGAQWVQVNYTD